MAFTFCSSLCPAPLPALHRQAQIRLLTGLCETIQADRDRRGADPPLLLLGAGLAYCSSLLVDAGPDPAADAAQAAAAWVEAEALALHAALRAALLRPPAPGNGDPGPSPAALIAALFPGADLPGSLYEARLLLRRCAELEPALAALGCQPDYERLAAAAQHLEAQAPPAPQSELQARARGVARYGEQLIQKLIGHVIATTDPEDPRHEARARALLQPLLELDGESALHMRNKFGRPMM